MKTGTYAEIWHALKKYPDKTVVVNCPVWKMETLIQAVKKIKSTENAALKNLDLPHYGRLKINIDRDAKTVAFSLTYSMQELI